MTLKLIPLNIQKRKLNKMLKGLYRDVALLTVIKHRNLYDVENSQLRVTPKYRVLVCSSCAGVDKFTIVTDDYDSIPGGPMPICAKLYKGYEKLIGYDSWKELIQGKVYKTVPKVNIKEYLKRLKDEKYWTWERVIDYLTDGTGMADQRIKEVMQSIVIKLPMKRGWQGLNNHMMAVTNSSTGKTSCFERLTGCDASKTFTEPAMFGGIAKDGSESEGQLQGEGAFAFDEYIKKFNQDHEEMLAKCLKYMTQGTTTRTVMAGNNRTSLTCVGTKTLCFLDNPPASETGKAIMPTFSKSLYCLSGRDGIDAAGTRLAHILYGDDFKVITTTEEDPALVQKLQFLERELEKNKRRSISKVLDYFKPWITTKDEEYEQYWDSVKKYCIEHALKKFFDYYKISWKRLKTGAVRRAILLHLPKLYEMNVKEFIELIKEDVYMNYEKFKKYNYKSFEFLHNTKKAIAVDAILKGQTYTEILLNNGWNHDDLPLPTYNNWCWELKKEKVSSTGNTIPNV